MIDLEKRYLKFKKDLDRFHSLNYTDTRQLEDYFDFSNSSISKEKFRTTGVQLYRILNRVDVFFTEFFEEAKDQNLEEGIGKVVFNFKLALGRFKSFTDAEEIYFSLLNERGKPVIKVVIFVDDFSETLVNLIATKSKEKIFSCNKFFSSHDWSRFFSFILS